MVTLSSSMTLNLSTTGDEFLEKSAVLHYIIIDMYFYLHGIVTLRFEDHVVIEVNGIGYEVTVPSIDDFPVGESQFIYVVYIISEDKHYFIGFKEIEEKMFFLKLTSVKGIGPKTALNMLKSVSFRRLEQAVKEGDEMYLSSLPSIGKKTANQIILDLKGKLALSKTMDNKIFKLAYDGLLQLGFKDKEIKESFMKIKDENMSVEDIISFVLKDRSK